jgi:anti-sigma factor ChrR (cupin superfamily)
MTDHPDRETLKRFVAGEQSSGEARRTDQHLSFCSECRDRADEISTRQALRVLDSWLSPSYDEAFDRAAERVVEAWSHHLQSGEDAYTETELLVFTASLRRDQSRYEEAVQLTDQAIALYREGQDSQLEARL